MPNLGINRGAPFSQTASGTTSAKAAQPAVGLNMYVTDINGSSTTAGTWAILGGATGTTTYWAGIGAVSQTFQEPIVIPSAGTVTFAMAGATATYANISGYSI